MEKREELLKSIDQMIDGLLKKSEEPVMDELVGKPKENQAENPQKQSARTDADAGEQPEKPEEDEDEKNGRPKDPSNQDHRDADGASKLMYPESISSPAMTPPNETTVAKSEKIEVSKEDFELLQKAKKEREEASLKKAREEQASLIKSVVLEATKGLYAENQELRKSLNDTQELLHKALKKPMPQKSVSNISALEKSFGENHPEGAKQDSFSKSEMLDAAERLVKSGQLPVEVAIEMEDTGSVYSPAHRALIEKELKRR